MDRPIIGSVSYATWIEEYFFRTLCSRRNIKKCHLHVSIGGKPRQTQFYAFFAAVVVVKTMIKVLKSDIYIM